mgnify:CR=1 FL=1|tara:strand:+ start:715 stop:1044 length:330 start_codon:yes stop_codon:yes gene_type:complete
MITFKEYYQGDKYSVALASPNNGKSMMRGDRKHQNLMKKDHLHKSPYINNLVNGGAAQIKLMGQPLLNTLSQYGMDFQPGKTKSLGNSHVEVKMFEDEEGNQCGMLTKK